MNNSVKHMKNLLAVVLIALLAACGGTTGDNQPGAPLSISITPRVSEAYYAENVELTAIVSGDSAAEATVTWAATEGELSSDSGRTATWTAPVGTGSVTITASIDGDEASDSITIGVGLCSSGSIADQADPCVLRNVHQLQAMNEQPAGHFALDADIDASETATWNHGRGFTPIGMISGPGANDSVDVTPDGDSEVQGRGEVGGLIGLNLGDIERSHSRITVIASGPNSGGLVGSNGDRNNSSAAIRHSFADGPLISNGDHTGASNNGGLAGLNYGTISDSYSSSERVESERSNTGGLVGYNQVSGVIERSYTASSVTALGTHSVGGLVGINWGEITQSYSLAAEAEATDSRAGGLVGYNRRNASVTETYSMTEVTAPEHPGGLIGENESAGGTWDAGVVERSFWDVQRSGRDTSGGGGTGLFTHAMLQAATFTSESWDFSTVWQIEEGNDVPDLRSNARPPFYPFNNKPMEAPDVYLS